MTAPNPYNSNPYRLQFASMGGAKPDAYTPYAVGAKTYGYGARTNATSGPVSPDGMQGYIARDTQKAGVIARQAMLNTMKAQQTGDFASPAWLGGVQNGV